jgi:ADP-ribosyl-[dinitrogen reductase] hydrolase
MSSGNGSLMRLAPVVMFYYPDFDQVLKYAGESSRTTHGSEECIDSCRYFASLIYEAFEGNNKQEILASKRYIPESSKLRKITASPYTGKPIEQIKGSGYVIESIEAALWCFANTESFDEAILQATNLGDDADTTAAICGQIAGAYYGVNGIKEEWLDKLEMKDDIEKLSDKLRLTV